MPIVLIEIFRAIRELRRDAGFVVLGVLLAVSIASGTVVYWLVEDLALFDALYLSVITLTTVGYGEPAPETGLGKAFTIVFVLVGLGILLAFLSMLAEHLRQHSALRRRFAGESADEEEPQPADNPLAGLGDYDLVVIGSDEASRRAAIAAAQAGLRVVLVADRQVPGVEERAA